MGILEHLRSPNAVTAAVCSQASLPFFNLILLIPLYQFRLLLENVSNFALLVGDSSVSTIFCDGRGIGWLKVFPRNKIFYLAFSLSILLL